MHTHKHAHMHAWVHVHYIFYGCFPCLCLVPLACSTHRDQKGALGPSKLVLIASMSSHVGAENQTQVLWKSSQHSHTGSCKYIVALGWLQTHSNLLASAWIKDG